ncbi:MAG: DUF3795 domain-containing protein [Thermoproteota archaeon]
MNLEEEMIAVCGLNCGSCDLRKAPEDSEAAERVVAWFRREGWLKQDEGMEEVIQRGMYCKGCRGDQSVHWSPECWMLKCCVDQKGHQFCYQCKDFPCKRLSERAQQNEGYRRALDRLKKLKEERTGKA